MRVVLVEDDKDYRESLEELCEQEGLEPVAFAKASEAIKYLQGSQRRPAAYMVDMKILGELDGPERLFHFVREHNPSARFYFMTANLSDHDEEVIARTGAQYLLKPHETGKYCVLDTLRLLSRKQG